ncbi:subtilase-type protease inhibitor [Streptomyces sp. NPDC090025]|uniref:subtilase-type protease inhibitor n=1 Tax=Streptomyces sp. NPDC090025 TaxID=3365922 RepID=UPI003837BA65
MRHIRTLGATAFATATGLALVGTAFAGSGTAEAAPMDTTGLYAPSVLVLTTGPGERPATASVVRAVTLSCTPTATGTHPNPAAACSELASVGGDLARLTAAAPSGGRPCTREWQPVTMTGDGVWQGKRVRWSATYGNACEMHAKTAGGAVFGF